MTHLLYDLAQWAPAPQKWAVKGQQGPAPFHSISLNSNLKQGCQPWSLNPPFLPMTGKGPGRWHPAMAEVLTMAEILTTAKVLSM